MHSIVTAQVVGHVTAEGIGGPNFNFQPLLPSFDLAKEQLVFTFLATTSLSPWHMYSKGWGPL